MAEEAHLWRPLGRLLVAQGVVAPHQIEQALAEQRRSGRRLGEILIAHGYTSRAAIVNALAQQAELLFDLDVESRTAADQALQRDLDAVLFEHAKDTPALLEKARQKSEDIATDFLAAVDRARHHLAARRARLRR